MQFHTRRRRPPTINIVPLIDILVLLLIFFLVTTTFRKRESAVQIDLPESKSDAARPDAKEVVVISITEKNQILLNSRIISVDELPAYLRDMVKHSPDVQFALNADQGADFGSVIRVLDALKDTGIKNIPAFAKPAKSQP